MHINFVNFGEGLVTAFSRYNKTGKIHTFPMGLIKAFSCWKHKSFSSIALSNGRKSSSKVLFIIFYV